MLNPIPARVQIQDGQYDTSIIASSCGEWQTVSPMSILPPNIRNVANANALIGKGANISLKNRYPIEIVDRAYLHSSYLTLFSLLGYPYIMQSFMSSIRQQINEGQHISQALRITVPTSLKSMLPFFDPRQKDIEISLISPEQDPEKACFVLFIAGELVLMPFISDHYKIIQSEINLFLSDLSKGDRRSFPFYINLMEIDPACKYSIGYVFEKGENISKPEHLKLSPLKD